MSKLAFLLLVTLLCSIQALLLGNYKLYNSKGSGLYDSSGNGNHGEISWVDKPILTDRGQYFYPKSSLKFPTNVYKYYPGSSSLIIALWFVAGSDGTLLKVTSYFNSSINSIKIAWEQNLTEVNLRFIDASSSTIKNSSLKFSNIYTDSWNFVVFSITQVSSNTQISFYPDAVNTPAVTHTFNGFQFANSYTMWGIKESDVSELKGFIYEIWWRDDLTTDISTTFSSYASPKPTNLTSPPELDPFKSYNSISCSTTCSNNKQSCSGSASSCVTACNSGCSCGCYRTTIDVCLGCKLIYCSNYDTINASCTVCMSNLVPNAGTCQCGAGSELIKIISSPQCRSPVPNCLSSYTNPENGCAQCNTSYKLICLTPPCPPLYECITPCPSGYYENLTSPASCLSCSSDCIACTDSTTCTQCSSTTFLKSGACVSTCGSGYYTNPTGTCEQCSSYCSTCTYSGASLVCVGCDSGYYLQGTVCVTECAAEYYLNGGICYGCPSNCSSCTSSTICTSCLAGFGLITASISIICDTCPVGKYASSSVCNNCPGTCTACSSDTVCSTCIVNASIAASSTMCSCNFGYTFSSGSCVETLSAAAIMNTDGSITLTFSSVIATSLSINLLSFRDESLIYDSTTFSLSTVTPNYIYSITLNKILLTGVNTMRLYFSSATIYSMTGKLLSNEYLDINISATTITSQCSSIANCSTCNKNGSSFICDSCRSSYCLYSDASIKCGSCCDHGYYIESINSSNVCTKCPTNCNTCTGISSCSSCIGSLYLLNSDCVSDCGPAKYKNTSNYECSDCLEKCEVCSDGNSCSLCASSTVYTSSSNKCEACPGGSYYESGVCVACSTLCASCYDSTSCTECVLNASISQEKCTCILNYTNIDNICIPLTFLEASATITSYQTISLTFNKSLSSYLSADSFTIMMEGKSYTSSSFSLQSISSQSFILTTKNITFLNISTITITFLNPSSIISLDSSTLKESSLSIPVPVEIRCVSSTGSPSICEICPDVCLLCSSSGCLECNKSYLLLESVCREECPGGYYEDILEDTCLSCGKYCISCEYEDGRVVCNECGEGSVMIYREGEVGCIEYGDREEDVCLECGGFCSEYEDEGCSVCMENKEIRESKCEENSNGIEVKLVAANIQYLNNQQFQLSFARRPTIELSVSSLSILSNSIQYSPSQFTLSKQSTLSPSSYLITLSNLDTSIPNTITFTFLSKLFSSEGYFPSKLTLELPADSSEESYSQAEIDQADTVESITSGMATTATVGAAVSIASGGSQGWGLLNTVQILSFLALIQVEMPLVLRSCIRAQENYYPSYDLFKDIRSQFKKPYKKAFEFKYRVSDFVQNIGKPIFILLIIISIHILSKLLFRFTKGKLKQIFEKVINIFNYGVYLRFFIMMYIEFSVPAVIQLLYVITTQPQDDTFFQISAYIAAIGVLVRFT
jgi:hypothetical protein